MGIHGDASDVSLWSVRQGEPPRTPREPRLARRPVRHPPRAHPQGRTGMATRRDVLAAGLAAATLGGTGARHALSQPDGGAAWDAGQLMHLLPTVGHDQILIKASFHAPLPTAPVLSVGGQRVNGVRSDTAGLFWQFHVAGLRPGAPHRLELT